MEFFPCQPNFPQIWEKIFGFPLFIVQLCQPFERSFGKNFQPSLV